MEQLRTISKNGEWYKGNLHNHTTLSDGKLTPEQLANAYRSQGYSFIAITDHWVYGIHDGLASNDFLIFSGVEFDVPITGTDRRTYHIVALADPCQPSFPHGHTFTELERTINVNKLTNYMVHNKNICICAHPYWSQIQMEEFDAIEGCIGTEIFNNGTYQEFDRGYAEPYYDRWLWENRKIFGFACDDTHPAENLFGGYIQVKAPKLTYSAVMQAVLSGSFYASTGPQLLDFYVMGHTAYVHCSACCLVSIHGKQLKGDAVFSRQDDITHAVFAIDQAAHYVYVVCKDSSGNKAWSQPIWLNNTASYSNGG